MLLVRKRSSNSRRDAPLLMRYIHKENVLTPRGFFNAIDSSNFSYFLAEVEATVATANNIDEVITHFILSFSKEEESVAWEKAQEIVAAFLSSMRFTQALSAWGLHDNSETLHIHVGVVMVDPVTRKSLNQDGIVRQLLDTSGVLCKQFNLSSPLWDYRVMFRGIEDGFSTRDWDQIHESLNAMNIYIENGGETGYKLRSGRWSVDMGFLMGKSREDFYFRQMGPVPHLSSRKAAQKPNIWIMRKAAQRHIVNEKKALLASYEPKISRSLSNARSWSDENRAEAEMEAMVLQAGLETAKHLLHFYLSLIRSVTQAVWNSKWRDIDEYLWRFIVDKERSVAMFERLGLKPRQKYPGLGVSLES